MLLRFETTPLHRKIEAKFCILIVAPVKLGEGWVLYLSEFHQFCIVPNIRYTFDRALLGVWYIEGGCQKKKEISAAFI